MDKQKQIESLKKRYGRSSLPAKNRGTMGGHGGNRQIKGGLPKNTKATISRLMSYLNEYKVFMGAALFCVLVGTLAMLAGSYMLRPIINQYIAPPGGGRGSVTGLAKGLIIMGIVYLIGVIANYAQSRIMLTVAGPQ